MEVGRDLHRWVNAQALSGRLFRLVLCVALRDTWPEPDTEP